MGIIKGLLVLLVATALVPQAACSEEETVAVEGKEAIAAGAGGEGWSYGFSTALLSKYVSRGAVISGDPVIQPEFSVGCNGWTLAAWNNVDLTDYEVAPWRLTETDLALAYAFTLSSVSLEAGYIYYTFPNMHVDDTQEAFITAAMEDVFLSPELTVYYDFDEVGGTYTNAVISHPVALPFECGGEKVKATFGALVGYGDSNYIGGCFDDSGDSLVDLVLSCDVPLRLSENWSLCPTIAYMQVLDSDLRKCTDKSDALYGGITLTGEF